MHVQIVTYRLAGISEGEYLDVASRVAPEFASMAGLQAKVWLEPLGDATYGAVYFWDDAESMERFMRSDLFEGTNPHFTDVSSRGYQVLENLTKASQPVLSVV
jgi:heme-degrading monooxygenase HmoA